MPPDKWYSSSIGNIPIGQGISVTPLQMAAMYSGIANGGVMVEPHVVAKIGGRPAPKPVSRRVLSPTVDHTLVNMLKGVVDTAAGTGTRASVPGYTVAGKTGTAQVALPHHLGYSTRNYVASFVGFLPADNPRVEVLVVVNSPRTNIFGGIVAAPAFQQIATFLTKDLAFPRINLLSWYLYMCGGILMLHTLLTGGVDTGWTFYTPFSTAFSDTKVIEAGVAIFINGFDGYRHALNLRSERC